MILLSALLTNVAGHTKIHDDVVFNGVAARFDTTQDKEALALMKFFCESMKTMLECWKWEVGSIHFLSLKSEV